MKHASKLLLILALAGTVLGSAPASSRAEKLPIVPAQAAGIGDPTQQHWWGVAGAVGCGFGIRTSIATGGNPWVVGVTVVMCLLALADGIS